MPTFQCPYCKNAFDFSPESETDRILCPHCNQSVLLQPILQGAPFQRRPAESKLQSKCSVCDGLMSIKATDCPHCGDPKQSNIPFIFYAIAFLWTAIGLVLTVLGIGIGISLGNLGNH